VEKKKAGRRLDEARTGKGVQCYKSGEGGTQSAWVIRRQFSIELHAMVREKGEVGKQEGEK